MNNDNRLNWSAQNLGRQGRWTTPCTFEPKPALARPTCRSMIVVSDEQSPPLGFADADTLVSRIPLESLTVAFSEAPDGFTPQILKL